MKLSKVGSFFTNYAKGTYYFGHTISNRFMNWVEAGPLTSRIGGGLFDFSAGAGVTAWGVGGAIMNGLAIKTAVTALATASAAALPITLPTAAMTVGVSLLFLTLNSMITGMGVGLLTAGYKKTGLPIPSRRTQYAVKKAAKSPVRSATNSLKSGISSTFGRSSTPKTQSATPQSPSAKPKKFDNF